MQTATDQSTTPEKSKKDNNKESGSVTSSHVDNHELSDGSFDL